VACFLSPGRDPHDRAQVEVFCYSAETKRDEMTARVQAASEHWREVAALSDDELADAIHADGIDVLVDLIGHTGLPRLGVFCRRPAPVQVAWLGYLNTTGLACMDFRLSDERADPPALAQPRHVERLHYLPASQWCYRAMVQQAISPVPPLERNGHLTFGSFNAAIKVTPAACRRWAQVMLQVPGSRLIIGDINAAAKRAAIRRDLEDAGVAADRVAFLPRVAFGQYLDLYNAVDITFDTFPYGGGTTTFDSLWMGVPVVAALGDTSVARSAASILTALGMDDWVAPSVDRFVDVAVARASDLQALRALRRDLRARLQASPLTDLPRYVRDLEAAYRSMWLDKTR
jgi:protein O-GlcNAc transferase